MADRSLPAATTWSRKPAAERDTDNGRAWTSVRLALAVRPVRPSIGASRSTKLVRQSTTARPGRPSHGCQFGDRAIDRDNQVAKSRSAFRRQSSWNNDRQLAWPAVWSLLSFSTLSQTRPGKRNLRWQLTDTILIDKLLHAVVQQGASDLHITVGQPPVIRLRRPHGQARRPRCSSRPTPWR